MSEPPSLRIAPRDASEAPTHINGRAKESAIPKPRASSQPQDSTSAKLLVMASLMSLVVVVLSLAVLSKTTGGLISSSSVKIRTDAPVHIEAVAPPSKEPASETAAANADLMLNLDVEPKDARLVVLPTEEGFEVKVAASGYQPATRTIEKGVTERIAIKLEPEPKRASKKAIKKKKPRKRSAKKRSVAKPARKTDAEVFLTGSDL